MPSTNSRASNLSWKYDLSDTDAEQEGVLHAIVVSVTVNDGESATRHLREKVVPAVSQAPGFVAGYWVRLEGGNQGRATMVFESEDTARQASEQISPAPDNATQIESIDIGEVVEHA